MPITAIKERHWSTTRSSRRTGTPTSRSQYAPVMSATARAHTFGRSLTATDKTRDGDERVAVDQPGRPHIVFFSLARSVLDRSVSSRRPSTGRIVRKLVDTALELALHQPAVHRLGRFVESRQPPVRRRRRPRRQGRAGDSRMSPTATSRAKSRCRRSARS